VYNSRGENAQQIQLPNDRSHGSVHQGITPPLPGPPPSLPDMGSSSSISASSQFGRNSRMNKGAGRSTFMMSRVNYLSVGSKSVDMYRTVFPAPGSPYHSAGCEMDSRADTVCAGEHFIPLFHHGTECDVSGYSDELGTMKNITVMKFATAIDDVKSHKTHILIVTFALYFGPKIKQSLICLNQCREGGTIIDECPRQFNPASKHGLTSPDETLFVPFQMHGQTSFFLSRQTSKKELDECKRHYLTSEKEWDPMSDHFADAEMNVPRFIGATSYHYNRSLIQPEEMTKRWGTSVEAARITLEEATTQRAVHNVRGGIGRRFKTSQQKLNHKQLTTKFYSDTFFPRVTSLHGNTCAQLFYTSDGYAKVYPMKLNSEAGSKLKELCSNVGIPSRLFTDNAGEETGGEWETVRHKNLTPQGYTEPRTPWQNKAELEIVEEKAHYRRIMHRDQAHEALWDHGVEHTDEIRQNLARKNLGWRTPFKILTGDTPDISDLLYFGYYDWVWYWDPTSARFPADTRQLG
jgi:hypothetical protein